MAGDLNPPDGPIQPTMLTLDQVEPRTPIGSLPFKITASGSYYLTGNLTGSASANGITIEADNVTIDLNGFSLIGVSGSLNGIFVNGTYEYITIQNGTMSGWGSSHIDASSASKTDVKAIKGSDSGSSGVKCGDESTVDETTVTGSGGVGIVTGKKSKVSDCSCSNNKGGGIQTGDCCEVCDCNCCCNDGDGCTTGDHCNVSRVNSNLNGTETKAAAGIVVGAGCTVNACTSGANTGDGIVAGAGVLVSGCSVAGNGDDGIELLADGSVLGNTAAGNGQKSGDGAGILVRGLGARVESNNATGNVVGIGAEGTHNLIIRNSAGGNGTNYGISSGNSVGAVINVINDGNFSSSNSWANLVY
jgi:hypothetical protein